MNKFYQSIKHTWSKVSEWFVAGSLVALGVVGFTYAGSNHSAEKRLNNISPQFDDKIKSLEVRQEKFEKITNHNIDIIRETVDDLGRKHNNLVVRTRPLATRIQDDKADAAFYNGCTNIFVLMMFVCLFYFAKSEAKGKK